MKIFVHIPDSTAPSFYRATLPTLHLYHDLSMHGITLIGDHRPINGENFDAYLIHRVVRADFWTFVNHLIENGKKVIWQTDDDLWNIPSWNPASKRVFEADRAIIHKLAYGAERIVVSTEHLKSLIEYPEKISVLPNLVDLSFFPMNKQQRKPYTTILWAGSPTHERDLQEVVEPIQRILEEFTDVRVVFWGYAPTELADFFRPPGDRHAWLVPKSKQVVFMDWAEGRLYFEALNRMTPDIALGPLHDSKFNYSKSSIKSLEMIAAGAAFIGTDLPPYQWIENGVTGMLVPPGDRQGWYDALKKLIVDVQFRKQLNICGQTVVRAKYCWQSTGRDVWTNFFTGL